ncbi:metal ABC transporter solute-binding protein, Zn/Mn family [Brevibacterium rongguiense]|nr:zinc ABC transporter substrate-binding protein [Brevibacterium rongguiense]
MMQGPRGRMRSLGAGAVALATAAVLAGCGSGGGADSNSGKPRVVTSTNVYADIASQIAGDRADVEAIIDDPNKDPHDYEASTADQLKVSKASIVVENGGGYDSFMDSMMKSADSHPAVVDAVAVSGLPGAEDAAGDHDHDHGAEESQGAAGTESAAAGDEHDEDHDADHADHADDEHAHSDHAEESSEAEESGEHDAHEGHDHGEFNEHVWYSVPTMIKVAHAIEDELKDKAPNDAQAFEDNTSALVKKLDGLNDSIAQVKKTAQGKKASATEPVPLWLFSDMGLETITPEEFLEAVEEGSDVPPLVLKKAQRQISDGQVVILGYNTQATNTQAEQLKKSADAAGVGVVDLTETMPQGAHYDEWMGGRIDDIAQKLASAQ